MKKFAEPKWQEKFSGKQILDLKDTCRVVIKPQGNKWVWEFTHPPCYVKIRQNKFRKIFTANDANPVTSK